MTATIKAIKRVVLPATVTEMEYNVFQSSKALSEIHLRAKNPPNLARALAMTNSNCIIYVPEGAKEAYAAATGWADVVDHIVEE